MHQYSNLPNLHRSKSDTYTIWSPARPGIVHYGVVFTLADHRPRARCCRCCLSRAFIYSATRRCLPATTMAHHAMHHTQNLRVEPCAVTVSRPCMSKRQSVSCVWKCFFIFVWLADHNLHQHHTAATATTTTVRQNTNQLMSTWPLCSVVWCTVPAAMYEVGRIFFLDINSHLSFNLTKKSLQIVEIRLSLNYRLTPVQRSFNYPT